MRIPAGNMVIAVERPAINCGCVRVEQAVLNVDITVCEDRTAVAPSRITYKAGA